MHFWNILCKNFQNKITIEMSCKITTNSLVVDAFIFVWFGPEGNSECLFCLNL